MVSALEELKTIVLLTPVSKIKLSGSQLISSGITMILLMSLKLTSSNFLFLSKKRKPVF
jgi:hypothetical protein